MCVKAQNIGIFISLAVLLACSFVYFPHSFYKISSLWLLGCCALIAAKQLACHYQSIKYQAGVLVFEYLAWSAGALFMLPEDPLKKVILLTAGLFLVFASLPLLIEDFKTYFYLPLTLFVEIASIVFIHTNYTSSMNLGFFVGALVFLYLSYEIYSIICQALMEQQNYLLKSSHIAKENTGLKLTLESSGIITWSWDPNNNEFYWSNNALSILRENSFSNIRTFEGFIRVIEKQDRQTVANLFEEALNGRSQFEGEFNVVVLNEHTKTMRLIGAVIKDDAGKAKKVIGSCWDISDRVKEKVHLKNTLKQFQTLSYLAPIGIFQTDAAGNCVYINDKFCKILDISPEEAANKGWLKSFSAQDITKMVEAWQEKGPEQRDFYFEGDFSLRRKTKTWLSCTATSILDDNQKEQGYLAVIADISDQKTNEKQLEYLAQYDTLTGLGNRTLFQKILQESFQKAKITKRHVRLLYIDLDGFKAINDSMGHNVGDLLLKEVAKRLLACIRKTDIVCRIGGDEFTILLENTLNNNHLSMLCERIISSVRKPFKLDDKEIFVSASIGIAVGDPKSDSPESIIKQADMALYKAKDQGRNNFQYYSSNLNSIVERKTLLGNFLHRALEKNELEIFYQPQVHVATGNIKGAEALMRWNHPELGMISPAEFIPIIEENGLIIPIGEWCLRQACKDTKKWLADGTVQNNFSISINLSARQFKGVDLSQLIVDVMQESGLSAKNIVLEITETILMQNKDECLKILTDLRKLGLRIAIDDFGVGYSSLNYLRQFPIDIMKIDRSFTANLNQKTDESVITSSIIGLAHNLNMRVVAEGVENKETLDILNELGCDKYQGYYFAKPLPEKEFIELVCDDEQKKIRGA